MNGITINIFLSVEANFEINLIDISLELKNKFELSYYVDGKRFYPHLSLLGLYIPLKNLDSLVQTAKEIFTKQKRLSVSTKDLFLSNSGIVMLRVEKNEELYNLHKFVLNSFNDYTEGLINDKYKDNDYYEELPKADRDKILKYGNKWVLENYDPHITFARLVNKNDFQYIKDKYENSLANQEIFCDALIITREYFGDDNKSEIIFKESLN